MAVTPNEHANAALDEAGIDTNAPGAAVMHRHLLLSLIRIAELEAALRKIADYPSLVPSEIHYQENPTLPRFPDCRDIARDALKNP